MPIRVLIVDDSAVMRTALSRMLAGEADVEVVATARDGEDALTKIRAHHPDVVMLDIEMPKLSGLDVLRALRTDFPASDRPAVLVCSTLTTQGSHAALDAMRLGAADYITKDVSSFAGGTETLRADVLSKIRAVGGSRHQGATTTPARRGSPHAPATHVSTEIPAFDASAFDLLLIGSSTGGPPILETVLCGLPRDLAIPVVVAQHMPALFTKSLSERLDQSCRVRVVHVSSREPLEGGRIHIIEGGKHGHIHRSLAGRLSLEVKPEPFDEVYKPSVNVLFETGAKACGSRCLGVVLTGMGEDGLVGARPLHKAGGTILAQNAATCAVYGMPRAVTEAGLARASLDPEQLARAMGQLSPAYGRSAA
ncbi:MAG: chemotaxis-specific protein-glutamate methyltransferase CheB [Phycisphaerales bacterium]|jgi:two-component system chemotaxis response regulator CheB|nr:chemotaxis-specific protein-glutamate methyltransferase CheB [Phycisphaerales bacterium]